MNGNGQTMFRGFGAYGESEYDMAFNAALKLGLIDRGASRAMLNRAFVRWAQQQGFTAAKYGASWDDLALAALLRAASKRGLGSFGADYLPAGAAGEDYFPTAQTDTSTTERYVGPGSASGWDSSSAVDTSYSESGGRANDSYPTSQVVSSGDSTSAKDWFGMGKDVIGTFVNIFGQRQVAPAPLPVAEPFPIVPVLVGAAALGLIALVVLKKKRSSVSGYRRSRRSKR